jgi:hypothetical protein
VEAQAAVGAPAEPFKGPEEATLTAKDLKPLGGAAGQASTTGGTIFARRPDAMGPKER